MIILPEEVIKANRVNPHLTLMFGPTKVGKTTVLSELPDCLIIDTEKGTKYIDALKVDVNDYPDIVEVVKALKKKDTRYKYIALDVIDEVIEWVGDYVKKTMGLTELSENFSAGYVERNRKIINLIEKLLELTDHLIIVGHEELKDTSDRSDSWERKSIDIGGKLGRTIPAKADAICRVYRKNVEIKPKDKNSEVTFEEQLYVSFRPTETTEAGSRCAHLKGQVFKFDWDKIYISEI